MNINNFYLMSFLSQNKKGENMCGKSLQRERKKGPLVGQSCEKQQFTMNYIKIQVGLGMASTIFK